jgi:transposase
MAKGKYEEWRTEEGLVRLRGWARDGLTIEEISQKIGVSRSTLNDWIKKYPDISDTIKKGKEVADREVEESLFHKACGFKIKIEKPFKLKKVIYDKKTGKKTKEEETVEYATEEVYIPPDTVAMIFWLKNRKPDVWKDRPENIQAESSEAAGVIEIPMVEE